MEIIKNIDIAVVIAWGVIELALGIMNGRKNKDARKFDRGGLVIMYAVISLGFFAGINISYHKWGRLDDIMLFMQALGNIIMVSGMIIRYAAMHTLSRHFTYDVKILKKHKLIKAGMYKYIRHPAYLGSLMVFLGAGLLFSNWISFICIFIPNLITFTRRMMIEEKALAENFGRQYVEYRKATKLLIPGVF